MEKQTELSQVVSSKLGIIIAAMLASGLLVLCALIVLFFRSDSGVAIF